MVKGVSRQVIVVQSPEPGLFDQAIFILKDEAVAKGVTNEDLLKEAKQLIANPKKRPARYGGPFWACGGGLLVGAAWLLTVLLGL